MKAKLNGERIRYLLEEKNITQKKMALDLHISPNTLNGYLCHSERRTDYEMVEAIALYLDVTVDYLIGKSELRQREAKPVAHGEVVLVNNYRQMSADNQKILETVSYELLHNQTTG